MKIEKRLFNLFLADLTFSNIFLGNISKEMRKIEFQSLSISNVSGLVYPSPPKRLVPFGIRIVVSRLLQGTDPHIPKVMRPYLTGCNQQ